MNKPFNPVLKLNKRAIIRDIGDSPGKARAGYEFLLHVLPRIVFKLLHTQRNPLCFLIVTDHLHIDALPDLQRF